MLKNLFLTLTILIAGLCIDNPVQAQCTDLKLPANAGDTFIAKNDARKTAEEQFTHILATLDHDVRFKVALANNMDGGFSKTYDFVTLTTLEDIYGRGHISVDPNGRPVNIVKRCVIIPKGTVIYGLIDHANSRYPFSIGGKGKLFVTLHQMKVDNGVDNRGKMVDIEFVEPDLPPRRPDNDGRDHKGLTRPCKHSTTPCVVGRRQKLTVSPGAIGAGAAAGLLLVKNGDSDEPSDAIGSIAALTFLEGLSKATGIDGLVNPPDAILKEKMVFEVSTKGLEKNPLQVFVPLAPPPDKEKDKEKDEKPKGK